MIDAYKELDIRVQKWIFKQGWADLREIQAKSVKPILSGDRDVLISASTAAGKTEAFFLPACTAVADQDTGFGILYVSPLKALINDQYRRLEELGDMLEMPVTPWHGDTLQSKKKNAISNPSGILLITPESLESLLIRDAGWVKKAFSELSYICIDEFHAFIGTERGQHLLSLLNRIEHLLERYNNPIPRVALSATLGDIESVPASLRPNGSLPCETITVSKSQTDYKVLVKGYIDPLVPESNLPAEYLICQEIYKRCRGGSHLVFANSRARTEKIAAQLTDFCEEELVPNEFFPHHGSLAKELRQALEARLQKGTLPTSAVCTMTLELGIDIGKVESVVQVTPPHSVSSLRQRMGRSGRRNSSSILRMLITESELGGDARYIDNLRLQLVQSLAMIRLLISASWFEPADKNQLHFSTLLHQVLAVIAQWGSIRVDQLYNLLCKEGPFANISSTHFKQLLSQMGFLELVQQIQTGELVLGFEGERITNSYKFYAVFKTAEEYRVINGNRTLGTLPVDSPIVKDENIIFGGRRWKVIEIDSEQKAFYVTAAKGGKPPKFDSGGLSIHDVVRQEMRKIYASGDYRIEMDGQKIDFLDKNGKKLFSEGLENFERAELGSKSIVQAGEDCYIFSWMGDRVVNTIKLLLIKKGFKANSFGGVVEVKDVSVRQVMDCLLHLASNTMPTDIELTTVLETEQMQSEKYDEYLPHSLLSEGYGVRAFDISGVERWIRSSLKDYR